MDSSVSTTNQTEGTGDIAFVGGGPAALVAAIALARRGVRTTVFERDAHPEVAPRFNPDRSYTIDISGHGLRALQHIDACSYFDDRSIQFKGLKILDQGTQEWTLPGWTGSRGHQRGDGVRDGARPLHRSGGPFADGAPRSRQALRHQVEGSSDQQ